ncbi:MAG: deoxyribose-phosphate aldolase [Firmicutes bacterium]|nr:deoxyribose-phosphate aldolase [Bacillota bacterium]
MDQQWFDLQIEKLSNALAKQGLQLELPQITLRRNNLAVDENIAKYIDHTLLKQDATTAEIEQLVAQAKTYGFAAVCVHPCYLPLVTRLLQDSSVKVGTVIGFPLGTNTSDVKIYECQSAIALGAEEIDLVLPIYALKNQDFKAVYEELKSIVEATDGRVVKVILETGLLTKEEIVQACLLARLAKVSFVKTSTGFGWGGATVEDVNLMWQVVADDCQVKASGGVRTREDALKMLQAGATRIGTSSGLQLVQGINGDINGY